MAGVAGGTTVGVAALAPSTAEAQAAAPAISLSGKMNNGVFEGMYGAVPFSMSFKGKMDPTTLGELNGQNVNVKFDGASDASGTFRGLITVTGTTSKGTPYDGRMPYCGPLGLTPDPCLPAGCGEKRPKPRPKPEPEPVPLEPLELDLPTSFTIDVDIHEAPDNTGVGGQLNVIFTQDLPISIGDIAEYGKEPTKGQFRWEIKRLDNSVPGVDDRKVVITLVRGKPGDKDYAKYESDHVMPDTVATQGKLEPCRFTLVEATPPFNTDPSAPASLEVRVKLSGDWNTGIKLEGAILGNRDPMPNGTTCNVERADSLNGRAIELTCSRTHGNVVQSFGGTITSTQLPANALGKERKYSLPRITP